MSFAFEAKNHVGRQVRALALQQIDKALEAAAEKDDFDKIVHALRRRCKKLRGLLRMVQPHFGDYGQENAAIRDAASLFGGARDARVMVETLDGLSVAGDKGVARDFLVARADTLAHENEGATILDRFAGLFRELRGRANNWHFDAHGFDLVGDGLERTYRQFRRDFAIAEEEGSATAMHEWRKRAKYHGHHVALLKKSAPDLLGPRSEALDDLGDALGDHHNLAVLDQTLNEARGPLGDLHPILAAIEEQQAKLAEKAFILGCQLTAEKPGALHRRFEAYWALLPEKDL